MCTGWIALTDSNEANGCLQVVDGEDTEEYRGMDVEELQKGAASIELKAGESVVHAQELKCVVV